MMVLRSIDSVESKNESRRDGRIKRSKMATSVIEVKSNGGSGKARGKKMASAIVNVDPTKWVNKVTTKVENPLDGKEIELTAEYEGPLATDYNSALNIVGGIDSDVWFWFNLARKIQMRYQAAQALEMDLDGEREDGKTPLNDLYSSFSAARRNLKVDKNTPEARVKKINDFILSQEEFMPLAEKLAQFKPENKKIVFGLPRRDEKGNILEGETEVELRKPTGIRGRQRKQKDGEESVDSGETQASE